MDVEQGGKILLLVVVIGIVIVIALGVSTTQQIGSQAQIENQAGRFTTFGTATPNALNITAANVLVITPSGSDTWISVSTPLSVVVTGNSITTYATNAIYSVPGPTISQTFSVNSVSGLQTTAGTGNYYNITAITLSGVPVSAYPSFNAVVAETYNSVKHAPTLPPAYAVNSISTFSVITYNYQAQINNFTTNQNNLANTQGSNANYAYYILFAALIIAIVIGALIKSASDRGK